MHGLIPGQHNAGPFFFHGFLRLISRAREIENDEFHRHFTDISRANSSISRVFHGLILKFHGLILKIHDVFI